MIGIGRVLRKGIDVALEVPVVTSFTRLGHDVRSRVDDWSPPAPNRLVDKVVVITGATSRLGRAAAKAGCCPIDGRPVAGALSVDRRVGAQRRRPVE